MRRMIREGSETETELPKWAEIPIPIIVHTCFNASRTDMFAFKLSWKTKSQRDKGWLPVRTMLLMNHKLPLDKIVKITTINFTLSGLLFCPDVRRLWR